MSVRFHQLVNIRLEKRNDLKLFISDMFSKNGHKIFELDIIFCDDSYLLDINRRFLKHDYYTDIITFNLTEKGKYMCAEIYISKDMVLENAKNQQVSFINEIHRVIFHGVLHLLGYDDETAVKKSEMRKMEDAWLKKYFRQTS